MTCRKLMIIMQCSPRWIKSWKQKKMVTQEKKNENLFLKITEIISFLEQNVNPQMNGWRRWKMKLSVERCINSHAVKG